MPLCPTLGVIVCRRSLWQILGRHKQSVILISPGCHFGEQVTGFETADLQAARELLVKLD
jgi:hypothetical protein